MIQFSHYDDKLTDGTDPYRTTAVYFVEGVLQEVVAALQVFLALDRSSIPADGINAAVLTVRTTGWETVTVEIAIGSGRIEQAVDIVDGVGTLELAADTKGTANISVKEVLCEPVILEVL